MRLPAARLRDALPRSAPDLEPSPPRAVAGRAAAWNSPPHLAVDLVVNASDEVRAHGRFLHPLDLSSPKIRGRFVLPSQTSLSHGVYAGHHDTERPIDRSVRWTPLTIPLQLQRALLRPLCAHVVLYVGPTRISPPPNWSARTHEQLQRAQEAARCVDIVAETIATRTTVPRHGQRPCSRYLLLYAHLLLAF
jgi:hypothetical protein